jgi:hypothetical protein
VGCAEIARRLARFEVDPLAYSGFPKGWDPEQESFEVD